MSNNPYLNRRVEFHILQSFPVTCLNRDDVGAPKTAMVGGVTRARVSSQCWKRAVRLAMHEVSGVELGVRTKLLSDLVAKECRLLGATEEQAKACGGKMKSLFDKKTSKKEISEDTDEDEKEKDDKNDTLLFLSPNEIHILGTKFKEVNYEPDKVVVEIKKDKKAGTDKPKFLSEATDLAKIFEGKKLCEALDGLDIALLAAWLHRHQQWTLKVRRHSAMQFLHTR